MIPRIRCLFLLRCALWHTGTSVGLSSRRPRIWWSLLRRISSLSWWLRARWTSILRLHWTTFLSIRRLGIRLVSSWLHIRIPWWFHLLLWWLLIWSGWLLPSRGCTRSTLWWSTIPRLLANRRSISTRLLRWPSKASRRRSSSTRATWSIGVTLVWTRRSSLIIWRSSTVLRGLPTVT